MIDADTFINEQRRSHFLILEDDRYWYFQTKFYFTNGYQIKTLGEMNITIYLN